MHNDAAMSVLVFKTTFHYMFYYSHRCRLKYLSFAVVTFLSIGVEVVYLLCLAKRC